MAVKLVFALVCLFALSSALAGCGESATPQAGPVKNRDLTPDDDPSKKMKNGKTADTGE